MKQREFPMLAGLPAPRNADPQTLRLCTSQADAIAASIVLSRVTQRTLAARLGISPGYLSMLKSGERVLSDDTDAIRLAEAICWATGTNLLKQYRVFEEAMRAAEGRTRATDRIAAIVAPTERAWGVAA